MWTNYKEQLHVYKTNQKELNKINHSKMSATKREELILPVDWDIIDACNGFSFDMGGSVMKIVFVDKKDWVEPSKRKPGSKGNLHMVNFSRGEIDQAMDFLVERVRIPKPTDGSMPTIYSTGFGGSQYADELMEKVNVKNNQLMETDCFNESILHLVKNLPRKEVLHPELSEIFEDYMKYCEKILPQMKDMAGMNDFSDTMAKALDDMILSGKQMKARDPDRPLIEDEDLFPCGMMMCGSGFGFGIIEADGTNRFTRVSCRGGKMLLGLGSLLLGVHNFEEILELSEKGNKYKVSTSSTTALEGAKPTDEDDIYGKWSEMSNDIPEELVFCYGNAHGKSISDFKKEDLASCLLDTHINDLVNMAYTSAAASKVKHVFFCGGFVNNPVVRKAITEHWAFHGGQTRMMDKDITFDIRPHFMIHGQSLGALGALLNHKLKWSEKKKSGGEKPQEEKK